MRVLHVSPYFAPAWEYGGPPVSIQGLCQALCAQDIEASVFTTTARAGVPDLPETQGWETEAGVRVQRFARTWPKRFFNSRPLRRALVSHAATFDVLHVHGLWNSTSTAAARFASHHDLPYVISPRGMLEDGARKKSAARKRIAWQLREQRLCTAASLLHATSDSEAETLATRVPRVPVATIPNGVNVEDVAGTPGAFRAEHGLSAQTPLVVFLGRQHRIKRIDLLAQAVQSVRSTYPDTRLILAGPAEEQPNADTKRALAALGDALIAVGRVDADARAALLADATVLVSCSDSESFGMSVAEALAAGVPVVTTHTTPWQVVESAGCGHWVAQTAPAIAEAIGTLLSDDDERRQAGVRATTLARERFSWEAVASRMAAAYKDVLVRHQQT